MVGRCRYEENDDQLRDKKESRDANYILQYDLESIKHSTLLDGIDFSFFPSPDDWRSYLSSLGDLSKSTQCLKV
jgi:hypothetical protein